MRDELPYVMHILHDAVRVNLHEMITWYIGTQHGFNISAGKDGNFFKKLLIPELYTQYAASFSDSNYNNIWQSVDVMCAMFPPLAIAVADYCGFSYHQDEEDGMRAYLSMIRK